VDVVTCDLLQELRHHATSSGALEDYKLVWLRYIHTYYSDPEHFKARGVDVSKRLITFCGSIMGQLLLQSR
jgi:hypothetical protein